MQVQTGSFLAERKIGSLISIKELTQQRKLSSIGSVNAGNAAELFAQPDIDGGLVGYKMR